MGIAAVSFKDKNGIEIVVYPQGEWDSIDFEAAAFDEGTDMIAFETKATAPKSAFSKLDIATSVDGKKNITTPRNCYLYLQIKRCQSGRD